MERREQRAKVEQCGDVRFGAQESSLFALPCPRSFDGLMPLVINTTTADLPS